jgi:hypothetical protein
VVGHTQLLHRRALDQRGMAFRDRTKQFELLRQHHRNSTNQSITESSSSSSSSTTMDIAPTPLSSSTTASSSSSSSSSSTSAISDPSRRLAWAEAELAEAQAGLDGIAGSTKRMVSALHRGMNTNNNRGGNSGSMSIMNLNDMVIDPRLPRPTVQTWSKKWKCQASSHQNHSSIVQAIIRSGFCDPRPSLISPLPSGCSVFTASREQPMRPSTSHQSPTKSDTKMESYPSLPRWLYGAQPFTCDCDTCPLCHPIMLHQQCDAKQCRSMMCRSCAAENQKCIRCERWFCSLRHLPRQCEGCEFALCTDCIVVVGPSSSSLIPTEVLYRCNDCKRQLCWRCHTTHTQHRTICGGCGFKDCNNGRAPSRLCVRCGTPPLGLGCGNPVCFSHGLPAARDGITNSAGNPANTGSSSSSRAATTGTARLVCACGTIQYCGKNCQKDHWKQHKPYCSKSNAAARQSASLNAIGNASLSRAAASMMIDISTPPPKAFYNHRMAGAYPHEIDTPHKLSRWMHDHPPLTMALGSVDRRRKDEVGRAIAKMKTRGKQTNKRSSGNDQNKNNDGGTGGDDITTGGGAFHFGSEAKTAANAFRGLIDDHDDASDNTDNNDDTDDDNSHHNKTDRKRPSLVAAAESKQQKSGQTSGDASTKNKNYSYDVENQGVIEDDIRLEGFDDDFDDDDELDAGILEEIEDSDTDNDWLQYSWSHTRPLPFAIIHAAAPRVPNAASNTAASTSATATSSTSSSSSSLLSPINGSWIPIELAIIDGSWDNLQMLRAVHRRAYGGPFRCRNPPPMVSKRELRMYQDRGVRIHSIRQG